MSYTVIAKYPPNQAGAVWWHVKVGDNFYIVSANTVPYSGPETYIFKSDEDLKWNPGDTVVEYRGTLSHELAIAELLEDLEEVSEEEDDTPTKISEYDALERFDDYLNEVFPTISICGYDYDPARALKNCDEIAYREEFNNWLDLEGLELE